MAQNPDVTGREILPIPDIPSKGKMALDARNAEFPAIKPLRPPKGAPNVVIVLIDDMGFGAPSVTGGPCNMPAMQKIHDDGLLYNRFHTTALCSPTRQALLTGRNHHSAGMGSVAEVATGAPGNDSVRPNTVATVAEMLRLNGYNTGAVGKMHQTPTWEVSMSGPFDRWPTGDGFEKFYGFVGGETNQWAPTLFLGPPPVEPPGPAEEGYHVSEDMVDKAIAWIRGVHTMTPDKPFFLYCSFGATHAPHHVAPEWIDKYKGKFDKGWDAVREETLANMKAKGVVPQATELTGRPEGVKAWEDLNETQKKVYARLMEVYAGFAEHTDAQVMRLIETLEEVGVYDDTLFIYIAGDNGASAEGGLDGTFNELMALNGIPQTLEDVVPRLDEVGGPTAFNHYPVGWAHAMNTPYQYTKQVASHWGGTRNSTAISWPKGIKAKGEIRQQFHHVIDIVPTILEAAGLPEPYMVNGVAQKPIEGVSMNYTFDDPEAEDRHTTQYFEMFGNRGIYQDGWTAVTRHSLPWITREWPSFDEDEWELYDTTKDWSQAKDLSKQMPEKLRELQQLFLIEAAKYNVFPLDDRRYERFNPAIAGRPDLAGDRKTMTFYAGMDTMMENTVLNIKNRSHTITAEVEVSAGKTDGVILAQGGRFAGWSLYVKDGITKYVHNWFDIEYSNVEATEKLPEGTVNVRYHFDFDGGQPGAGGTGRLYYNDQLVGEGKITKTVPFVFSADETLDVGGDLAMPVTDDYPEGEKNKFKGTVNWVRIDLEDDDVSHLEPEEQKYRRIIARQ
ncbi:MAG: arylsulfatase [Deltaproteobacteria bacterium]|jgi:arylsulfatase|nr:arylsulfatase [Deltaproteobacteria bacterium]